MSIKADLSGIQSGFKAAPAGTYACKITKCELTEAGPSAKNAGAPMLKWEFTVQPPSEYVDRKFFMNTLLVQEGDFGGLNRIKEILAATGLYTEEQLAGPIDFEPDDVIGVDVRCTVRVKPETEQYDEGNDVRRVRPMGEDEEESSLLP
jgi:hypothetical protein